MKRLLLTTSIAILLLSSAAAMARDHGKDKHDRYDDDRYGYNDRNRDDHDRYDRRYDDRRHDNSRHLGQIKQGYRRGMRAPAVYLQLRYYVTDFVATIRPRRRAAIAGCVRQTTAICWPAA